MAKAVWLCSAIPNGVILGKQWTRAHSAGFLLPTLRLRHGGPRQSKRQARLSHRAELKLRALFGGRTDSITAQSARIYEIIALDDASTDGSEQLFPELLSDVKIDCVFAPNTTNSGSACRQWLNGVTRARGDIVWIAEADDLSDPNFVSEMISAFDNPNVVMAYCQSQQMGAEGQILDANYLAYVADMGCERWTRAHVVDGEHELSTYLSVKNVIPNVSACLFRRDADQGSGRQY